MYIMSHIFIYIYLILILFLFISCQIILISFIFILYYRLGQRCYQDIKEEHYIVVNIALCWLLFFSFLKAFFEIFSFLFWVRTVTCHFTKLFQKVLTKSLSFLISFLFQLLLFQKVLIGFEFFKFCDF